jgi:glycosyltransferase involved in cell wall biosynthesis
MEGVSVIICCYNSVLRLKDTLSALAGQHFRSAVPWEIVLVDNASTDGTSTAALDIWESLKAPALLRIVHEPAAGLIHARKKGIHEAAYSTLLFCDDDNWLCPDYVQGMFDALSGDSLTAACGGKGIPVFETEKPQWFDEYAEAFATGSQDLNTEDGRILSLYGAGLAVKKQALDALFQSDFRALAGGGRKGKNLGSAEDIELTYALVLKGYRLSYNPDLTFYHYLPKERLTIRYLRRLFHAFGKDGPVRNLYYAHLTARPWHQRVTNWYFHLGLSLIRTGKYLVIPPKKSGRVLYLKWNIAYLGQLLTMKADYQHLTHHISRLREPAREPGITQITIA